MTEDAKAAVSADVSRSPLHGISPDVRRSLIFSLLVSVPMAVALRPDRFADNDIYWHLSAGDWIWRHHSVPRTDPFTASGANWQDYSWLFDLLVQAGYRLGGPVGVLAISATLTGILAVVVYALVKSKAGGFVRSVAITAVALVACATAYTPRPWLFSLIFFALELWIVLAAREGNPHWLWCLLPLFILWANIHIQFVYGLAVLAGFAVEAWLASLPRFSTTFETRARAPQLTAAFVGALLAVLVNPYGAKLFSVVHDYANSRAAYAFISELQSPSFRDPSHYVALGVIAMAMLFAGRQKGRIDIALVVLVMALTFLGFRSVRDIGYAVVVAAIIAARSLGEDGRTEKSPKLLRTAGMVIVAGFCLAIANGTSNAAVYRDMSASYPVHAASYLEQNRFRGPIYTIMDWGGFVIWRLPGLQPTIDGRTNVHGDERIVQHVRTWRAETGWDADSDLQRAPLILSRKNLALNSLLVRDPRYQIVYEDELAIVYKRRTEESSAIEEDRKRTH